MGNTCKPMAVSFQCMTKFTTNKKEKKRILQIGKRNKVIPTIVIGLKTTLHQKLVKFALDKEDKSVLVYFLLFTFLFAVTVCNVFVQSCLVFVDYKECLQSV